jgi:hypothetical protein
MFIAKVTNGQVGEIVDFRSIFGMTNSVTDEQLAAQNFVRVNLYRDHDRLTQKLVSCDPVLENGWVYRVAVADLTAGEIQSAKDDAMAQIRGTRTRLLAACDWTQIADSTTDKAAWAAYRQQLRDLPAGILTSATDPRTFTNWPRDPDWVDRKMP